jgi:CheY-like chemotaxis protein
MNRPVLLPGVSVLVVDDEADVRDLARAILERAGCAVVTAEDGVDALEKLADGFEPLVIILDLEMPRLDGEGVLRALATHPRKAARVIVFTAHPFRRPASAAICIQKPCSASGLIGAVSRVLAA